MTTATIDKRKSSENIQRLNQQLAKGRETRDRRSNWLGNAKFKKAVKDNKGTFYTAKNNLSKDIDGVHSVLDQLASFDLSISYNLVEQHCVFKGFTASKLRTIIQEWKNANQVSSGSSYLKYLVSLLVQNGIEYQTRDQFNGVESESDDEELEDDDDSCEDDGEDLEDDE
jgi:hypothetical protein